MLAMPGLRTFSLSPDREAGRVSCNADGLFVGDVPLLERSCTRLLPRMLDPGTTLNVVLPDNTVIQFTGIGQ